MSVYWGISVKLMNISEINECKYDWKILINVDTIDGCQKDWLMALSLMDFSMIDEY